MPDTCLCCALQPCKNMKFDTIACIQAKQTSQFIKLDDSPNGSSSEEVKRFLPAFNLMTF